MFISYAREDAEWRDWLCDGLRAYERQRVMEVWHDDRTETGTKYEKAIQDAMERCRVAVVLVSWKSLRSDFVCEREVPYLRQAAEANRVRLVPIVIETVDWELTGLGAYQAVNDVDTQALVGLDRNALAKMLTDISKEIRDAVKAMNG